jgi:hypothetical protein
MSYPAAISVYVFSSTTSIRAFGWAVSLGQLSGLRPFRPSMGLPHASRSREPMGAFARRCPAPVSQNVVNGLERDASKVAVAMDCGGRRDYAVAQSLGGSFVCRASDTGHCDPGPVRPVPFARSDVGTHPPAWDLLPAIGVAGQETPDRSKQMLGARAAGCQIAISLPCGFRSPTRRPSEDAEWSRLPAARPGVHLDDSHQSMASCSRPAFRCFLEDRPMVSTEVPVITSPPPRTLHQIAPRS